MASKAEADAVSFCEPTGTNESLSKRVTITAKTVDTSNDSTKCRALLPRLWDVRHLELGHVSKTNTRLLTQYPRIFHILVIGNWMSIFSGVEMGKQKKPFF